MSFDAPKLMLAGLARFELPGKTLTLCDGGFVWFDGEKYTSADPEWGTIEAIEGLEESAGDEAPGGTLTFLPATTAAAATLSQPHFQGSPMRFWIVRIDEQTGEVVHSELIGELELDTTTLRIGKGLRRLDVGMISVAERLFSVNEGNVLSPRFHESVWPGELGLANATGTPLTVAWGSQAPPRGAVAGGDGGGGNGGGSSGGGFFGFLKKIF